MENKDKEQKVNEESEKTKKTLNERFIGKEGEFTITDKDGNVLIS